MPHTAPAILITAGTRRLGLAMAKKSLALGYEVVLHYRSSNQEAQEWIEQNPHLSPKVHFVDADLRNSPSQLIEEWCARFPYIEGLVNNASVFNKGDLANFSHLKETLLINALIPMELAAAFSRSVKEGWIINITDANIYRSNLPYQNYRMSKRLLEDATRQLALAFAPRIRVNAIAPGAMLPAPGQSREEFLKLKQTIPLRKTGSMESLQSAYEYLIKNTYITGQIMYVDGGRHIG
ncbi:MAG: SDR family oxidoreductase [Chitinivibrionales bacterium]|nr:SDR family oxidoreductase [Chitinivibrionales bacterium]